MDATYPVISRIFFLGGGKLYAVDSTHEEMVIIIMWEVGNVESVVNESECFLEQIDLGEAFWQKLFPL